MDKLMCLKILKKTELRSYMPGFHMEKINSDSYCLLKMRVHDGNADQLFTSPMLARHINAFRHCKNLQISLINSASTTKNEKPPYPAFQISTEIPILQIS